MKKVKIDKAEEEVDKWKLKAMEETAHMTEEEKEKFLKAEIEQIKKEFNFTFLEEEKDKTVYPEASTNLKPNLINEDAVDYNQTKEDNK